MNNLAFKFLDQPKSNFEPKIVASVSDLSRYDMLYIYHHLSVESKVNLKLINEDVYEVSFKEFKLGFVRLSKWNPFRNKKVLGAKISYIEKANFMPIHKMEIEISGAV